MTTLTIYRFDVRVWNFDVGCLDTPDDGTNFYDVVASDLKSAIAKIKEQYGRPFEIIELMDSRCVDFI